MIGHVNTLACVAALLAVPAAYVAGQAGGVRQADTAAAEQREEQYGRQLEQVSAALTEGMRAQAEREEMPSVQSREAAPVAPTPSP